MDRPAFCHRISYEFHGCHGGVASVCSANRPPRPCRTDASLIHAATAGKSLYRLTIQSKAVDALSVRPHSNAVFTAKPESGESARRLPNPRIPSACRKELRGTASMALCGAEGRVLLFFHRAPQAAQQPHGECFAAPVDAPNPPQRSSHGQPEIVPGLSRSVPLAHDGIARPKMLYRAI